VGSLPIPSAQISFTVSEGGFIDKPLSFRIRSIVVDNTSGDWVYFPGCKRYVPPHTHNVTLIPHSRLETISAVLEAPSGQTQGGVADELITVTCFDELLAPSSIPTQINVVTVSDIITTLSVYGFANVSGSTAAANVSQQFNFGAGFKAVGSFFILNPRNATESLWLSLTGAAVINACIELVPGASFNWVAPDMPQLLTAGASEVSIAQTITPEVIAASLGHAFIAYGYGCVAT
jgi:hypothetical protein